MLKDYFLDSPQHHCVFERYLHGPRLPSEFTIHLKSDLGCDTHQTLGLVQHGGGDALAGGRLLDDALLLDRRVVVSL